MRRRITNPTDFWAGVMFVAVGGMCAGTALTYSLGTTKNMGAGFFPFWLGVILVVLGVGVASRGVRRYGPAVERLHWRTLLTVLASVCAFGLLLNVLGLFGAGMLLVAGASFGSREFKRHEVVLLALGLAIFCALLFVAGLKLPIPLCPGMDLFERFAMCRQ